MEKSKKNEIFAGIWEQLSQEERNVVVSDHLRSLSDWDLKRVLCTAFDIDYIDDDGLSKKFKSIVWTR